MSGHADGYSQADREKDTMTPAKQALRVSGHADPIRESLTRSSHQLHRDIDALLAARDHLNRWGIYEHNRARKAEAENQRLREWEQSAKALSAQVLAKHDEIIRLRAALDDAAVVIERMANGASRQACSPELDRVREALAGDPE